MQKPCRSLCALRVQKGADDVLRQGEPQRDCQPTRRKGQGAEGRGQRPRGLGARNREEEKTCPHCHHNIERKMYTGVVKPPMRLSLTLTGFWQEFDRTLAGF